MENNNPILYLIITKYVDIFSYVVEYVLSYLICFPLCILGLWKMNLPLENRTWGRRQIYFNYSTKPRKAFYITFWLMTHENIKILITATEIWMARGWEASKLFSLHFIHIYNFQLQLSRVEGGECVRMEILKLKLMRISRARVDCTTFKVRSGRGGKRVNSEEKKPVCPGLLNGGANNEAEKHGAELKIGFGLTANKSGSGLVLKLNPIKRISEFWIKTPRVRFIFKYPVRNWTNGFYRFIAL